MADSKGDATEENLIRGALNLLFRRKESAYKAVYKIAYKFLHSR